MYNSFRVYIELECTGEVGVGLDLFVKYKLYFPLESFWGKCRKLDKIVGKIKSYDR